MQPYTEYLTGFLAARVAEDKAAAERVAGRWVLDVPGTGVVLVGGEPLIEGHIGGLAEHIARHDPARVLLEAALKQLILGRHPPKPLRYVDADRCPRCAAMWPCPEVEALALVYSAHQDWRPPP